MIIAHPEAGKRPIIRVELIERTNKGDRHPPRKREVRVLKSLWDDDHQQAEWVRQMYASGWKIGRKGY